MTCSAALTNGGVTMRLEWDHSVSAVAANLREFLAPCFQTCETQSHHFRVVLLPFETAPAAMETGGKICLRRSSAAVFNLEGQGFHAAGQHGVLDPVRRTAIVWDDRDSLQFYVSPQSEIYLIEIVRSLALLVEESLGSLILHAAATVKNGAVYLILGPKGAGKTTTMMRLVVEQDHRYFSGDKVLCSEVGGGLILRGWPDYPHVGAASLASFPGVAAACGASYEPGSAEKLLLDPVPFRRALRESGESRYTRIAAIFLPRQDAASVASIDPDHPVLESIEYPHEYESVRWHRLPAGFRTTARRDFETIRARLRGVPCWQVPARRSFAVPEALGSTGE